MMAELGKLGNFLHSWFMAIVNYLLAIPREILVWGFLFGFLCAAIGWQKDRLKGNGILFKIFDWSSLLAVMGCLFMAGYILWNIGGLSLFYYAFAVIIGVVACKILHAILGI